MPRGRRRMPVLFKIYAKGSSVIFPEAAGKTEIGAGQTTPINKRCPVELFRAMPGVDKSLTRKVCPPAGKVEDVVAMQAEKKTDQYQRCPAELFLASSFIRRDDTKTNLR